jgi:ATP-dependent DNA helicase RecG
MNKESQNTEWKESWRDEYLKWICGFANAQGGVLFIGKNDKGVVTGIDDAGKLLEEIPNKVRDILGIIVDVNLLAENEKEYLEILTEAYPYPISYKGQYHYRSGSTKQELKGAALDKFLLQKQGKRWEGVPVPNVGVTDLSEELLHNSDIEPIGVKDWKLIFCKNRTLCCWINSIWLKESTSDGLLCYFFIPTQRNL